MTNIFVTCVNIGTAHKMFGFKCVSKGGIELRSKTFILSLTRQRLVHDSARCLGHRSPGGLDVLHFLMLTR